MRTSNITRDTTETQIQVQFTLDGSGKAEIATGIGFFDHMLHHLARHGLFDLIVKAKGDLEIDGHHTVEDVGICLGKAFHDALGDCRGLTRYSHAVIPMDECLAEAVVDLSGRPFFAFHGQTLRGMVGDFDAELTEEFLRAFATNARVTLHVTVRNGGNLHHTIEGIFKAMARALDSATIVDTRKGDTPPSTKGMIDV